MKELLELYEFNELLMMQKCIDSQFISDLMHYRLCGMSVITYYDTEFPLIFFGKGYLGAGKFYDSYKNKIFGK